MEFILVLPLYAAALGGILWLGTRSLDAIGLRSADRWGAWEDGARFEMRAPAITSLQSIFPRTKIIAAPSTRALASEDSFLQFIGAKAYIETDMPEYLENWLYMPYIVSGGSGPSSLERIFNRFMNSSRRGNDHTHFVIMRTRHSTKAKRHWHPSLIYEHDIWDFDKEKLPKKWDKEMLSKAKYTDDNRETKKEPEKIEFYTRFSVYEKWSEEN